MAASEAQGPIHSRKGVARVRALNAHIGQIVVVVFWIREISYEMSWLGYGHARRRRPRAADTPIRAFRVLSILLT